jgi:hypothetical protein
MVEVVALKNIRPAHDFRALKIPPKPQVQLPVCALESEGSIAMVSVDDLSLRRELAQQLRSLPPEALHNLRHFQTQVGCLNRCSFCSQGAGTTLWNMPRQALANLVSALKTVSLENAITMCTVSQTPLNEDGVFSLDFQMPNVGLIGSQRRDRPGVIYCYLDNDPATYPHLDDMIRWLHEDLGVKVRIATVGYSRKNLLIQHMHDRISSSLMDGIAGIRLSFSPYTYGWTRAAQKAGAATRREFELDTAALLQTYRHTFLSYRKGRKGACVELRFKPLVVSQQVEIELIQDHLVIRSGSYLVIQQAANGMPAIANIRDPRSHGTELSTPGEQCYLVRAHPEHLTISWRDIAQLLLHEGPLPLDGVKLSNCIMHRLENEDGEYFAIDAERIESGVYSKFFYPNTGLRPGPGVIDGERYHLNALLSAKRNHRAQSWLDFDALVAGLESQAKLLAFIDGAASKYIQEQVIELIKSYVNILKIAEYPSEAYFDKELSVDTGHICNLGRAYHEYKNIASRADLPMTPNHERAFGPNGELADEGLAWRLSVTPETRGAQSKSGRGARNTYQEKPSILIEKLDLAMTATTYGQSREKYFLSSQPTNRITVTDTLTFPLIPGHAGVI